MGLKCGTGLLHGRNQLLEGLPTLLDFLSPVHPQSILLFGIPDLVDSGGQVLQLAEGATALAEEFAVVAVVVAVAIARAH